MSMSTKDGTISLEVINKLVDITIITVNLKDKLYKIYKITLLS